MQKVHKINVLKQLAAPASNVLKLAESVAPMINNSDPTWDMIPSIASTYQEHKVNQRCQLVILCGVKSSL